ncbi:unnamed protein product [Lymnaea stagnalis]|uniref:Uncharacterized protein n=1 Tax=Lymnaea stagnalis TaxID=6523 RepID=A0AAV2GZJ6_LYMST
MADSGKSEQEAGANEDHHLVREGHVMRNIVRNMVVNMECVLNDLQGIMGDIQSLVVQIDTVTEKIDKQCGTEGAKSQGSLHRVQKPRCTHGSPLTCGGQSQEAVAGPRGNEVLKPRLRQEGQLGPINHQGRELLTSHPQVEQRLLRRVAESSGLRDNSCRCIHKADVKSRPKSSDVYTILEKTEYMERLTLGASKSFHHFSNSRIPSSPSGTIAVVHPTVFSNQLNQGEIDDPEVLNKLKSELLLNSPKYFPATPLVVQCLPLLSSNIPHVVQSTTLVTNNEHNHNTKRASRSKHVITSVYNKSFQPVTPTEQQSPAIQPKNATNAPKMSPGPKTSAKENEPPLPNVILPQDIHERLATSGRSLPASPRLKRSATCLPHASIPSSPHMKRSSTKAIYAKIDGSTPSTFGKSSGSIRVQQPSPHHYYHSIDSDLDAEVVGEYPDIRSMTPDMDWSYLNLVGNQRNPGFAANRLGTIDSNSGYEVPVVSHSTRVPQPFQMLQTSPDVVSRLPVFHLKVSMAEDRFMKRNHTHGLTEHFLLDTTSPLINHIFCTEVSSIETGFYCGCYEAILDSVLENIAGYETFEEACDDLDSDVITYESYVSFDDEFEEDDWDMGLRPEDDLDTDLPSFNIEDFYDNDQRLLDDINKNISAAESLFYVEPTATAASDLDDKHLHLGLHQPQAQTTRQSSKRRLSPSTGDEDVYDDVEFPETPGNCFTDEDCCAIKPHVTGHHQNFFLWPKSLVPDVTAGKGSNVNNDSAESENPMTSSDEASCQAVGSGSPMSFSSPEAAFTSPDTDRFVTSSEGDDLLTSQEEGYFLSSEALHTSHRDNVNTSAKRTNMRQLRREFFESLYTVCERRDKELSHDNVISRLTDEHGGFEPGVGRVDNTRDNLSDTGSYSEDFSSYNRNVNTWTAYAMVHMQSDDVSDCASDIINDNNVTCSMTSSYIDADNIGAGAGGQGMTC